MIEATQEIGESYSDFVERVGRAAPRPFRVIQGYVPDDFSHKLEGYLHLSNGQTYTMVSDGIHGGGR